MKKIKLIAILASIGVSQLFLSSCNTSLEVMKRQHSSGYYIALSNDKKADVNEVANSEVIKSKRLSTGSVEVAKLAESESAWSATKPSNISENLIASVDDQPIILNKAKEVFFVNTKERVQKPILNSVMRKALKNATTNPVVAEVNTLLLVILAILLPPLAVYLVDGMGTSFLISILLWLLFILPGIIYALYRVFSSR